MSAAEIKRRQEASEKVSAAAAAARKAAAKERAKAAAKAALASTGNDAVENGPGGLPLTELGKTGSRRGSLLVQPSKQVVNVLQKGVW